MEFLKSGLKSVLGAETGEQQQQSGAETVMLNKSR